MRACEILLRDSWPKRYPVSRETTMPIGSACGGEQKDRNTASQVRTLMKAGAIHGYGRHRERTHLARPQRGAA